MKRETVKKIVDTFSDDELIDAGLLRFASNRKFMEHYGNGGDIKYMGTVGMDLGFRAHKHCYEITEKTQKVINKKSQKVVECPMWIEVEPEKASAIWVFDQNDLVYKSNYSDPYYNTFKAGNLYDSEGKAEAVREAIYGDGQ